MMYKQNTTNYLNGKLISETKLTTKVKAKRNVEIDLTDLYDNITQLIEEITLPIEQHNVIIKRINQIFEEV